MAKLVAELHKVIDLMPAAGEKTHWSAKTCFGSLPDILFDKSAAFGGLRSLPEQLITSIKVKIGSQRTPIYYYN